MKRVTALAGLFLIAACATISKPTHLTGGWGGPHIGLLFEGGVATVQYDCASGTIDSAIFPGGDGRFTATGTHRPGQGGPVRVGQIFTSHRATYTGTETGDQMTLSVEVEGGDKLGPFTLTRDSPPQLTRCL